MRHTHVPLEDLVELADSGTWGDEADETNGVPVLRSTNIQAGTLVLDDIAWRRIPDKDRTRRQLLDGDIIVTKSSGSADHIGKCCSFRQPRDGRAYYFSNFILRLRVSARKVDQRWLFYWLTSPAGRHKLTRLNSTTTGLRNLDIPRYLQQEIPVVPLADQLTTCAILDKAAAIHRKRKEAIALTEELLRSAFLEMFGDPVTNPKGWPTITLAEIADVNRGKFTPRPRNDPRFYGGEYPFIQTGDLTGATGYLLRWRQTLNKHGTLVSRGFPKGAIAITIAANIGDTAIVDFDFWCPDSVVVIEPRAVPSEFLEFLMRFLQPSLEAMAPETAQKNINLEVLRPLRIILPPKSAQERFAEFYKKAYITKQRQAQAATESENLFSSLLDRAFRGKLTAPTSKSASRPPKQLSLLE